MSGNQIFWLIVSIANIIIFIGYVFFDYQPGKFYLALTMLGMILDQLSKILEK